MTTKTDLNDTIEQHITTAAACLDDAARDRSPLNRLDALYFARVHAEEAVVLAVEQARKAGLTWRQIGDKLDVTPQAAQQRYGS